MCYNKVKRSFIEQLYSVLITSAVSIVVALSTFITTWLKNKSIKRQVNDLKQIIENSDGKFYLKCPKCGYKVSLNDTEIKKE